jgi:DNA-binding LacI/PurR family transcriptional regulator
MKVQSITIKDIAKALDMSFSTVARALNDNYSISEATRKRVKEYATQHNYQANLTAQSLKKKGSRSIGICLCAIPNNFYAEVINGIESIASDNNYHVIITQSHESFNKEVKNVEYLQWRSVDGLLVSIASETNNIEHFNKLQSQGIPVVFFDRITSLINTHLVVADNVKGTYNCISHLIENDFKRIAHITSSPALSITTDRLEGYKKALGDKKQTIDESIIKYCAHGGMIREEIEKAVDELLNLENPPDAIFTASDRITIGCFSILKQRNIKIPDKIALAGFSNFSAPELFCPSLTTVTQPAFEIGKVATELLIKLIESKKPVKEFEKRVLPTELVIRDSSRR